MRVAIFCALFVALLLLQIIFGSFQSTIVVLPNLILIAIIIFSVFLPLDQILYLALIGGLILDIHSGRNFGLNVTFLIFVALFCKTVLRVGERNKTGAVLAMLIGMMAILYSFLQFVSIFSIEQVSQARVFLVICLREVSLSLLVGAIMYFVVAFLTRQDRRSVEVR